MEVVSLKVVRRHQDESFIVMSFMGGVYGQRLEVEDGKREYICMTMK